MKTYDLIKDAERYRYLRNMPERENDPHVVTEHGWWTVILQKGKKLDTIVDNAIKRAKKRKNDKVTKKS